MTATQHDHLCRKLCNDFGTERIIAALPQDEVKELLGLISIKELAEELAINYDTLRSRMDSKQIPYPEVRLRRRAYYTREQADEIKRMVDGTGKTNLTYKRRRG